MAGRKIRIPGVTGDAGIRKLRISMGADHGGFALKEGLKKYLERKGAEVKDYGAYSEEPCDYPPVGYKAARDVGAGKADFGIVICKTGFGMAIVANKVRGVRSAVCDSGPEAESARKHNDCNVLTLAATRVSLTKAKKIADIFLREKAEGGRHRRRVSQIIRLERKNETS